MFVTVPIDVSLCNGVSLDDDISQIKANVEADSDIQAELNKTELQAIGGWAHGLSFTLFPVPEVAYFAMGSASFNAIKSRLVSTVIEPESAEMPKCPDTRKLDYLIRESIEFCPSIKRRFQLREKDESLYVGYQSERHKTRLIAANFPELGKTHHAIAHKKNGIGWGAGTYGQVGVTGVASGIFGGASFKAKSLTNNYNGCHQWKKVIELWSSNPLFSLDPDEVLEIFPDCDMDA